MAQKKILGKHIKFKKNNKWFSAHDGVKNKPIKRKVSGIGGVNCCNPMGYESSRIQVDNALMAGSILFNDIEAFKSSLKGFVDVIDTMRADGSLPYQTSRGNAAIWYHNLGINVLIAMAEMATYQGVDLYSFKSKNDTDIHDAISFLLNSLENTNLVHKYASGNINPWRSGNGVSNPLDYKFQVGKDKIFKWQRGVNKASFLSWYEIYKYRFPDHDNLKRLHKIAAQTKKRLANSIDLPYEPPTLLYNDYSGMSPSCLYYKHGDVSLEPLGKAIEEDVQANETSKPKYDRTVAGMKVRFKCLVEYAAANDIAGLPSKQEIESLTTNLEGNDYYRSKRQIVKAGISKESMDANKAALVRLVNFEGTNDEYCAKPLL
ncbi:alginate lyase family protein [Alphaproteobacteria bacterium]|nr:alginate lyase family protein [Alphaproteobacteria bacterium]